MTSACEWKEAILDFWLREIGANRWWQRSDETDEAITIRFGSLWEEQRSQSLDAFLADASSALAAILLFDQFSRNMFRAQAKAFETDTLARAIARKAIALGFDTQIELPQRAFFYLPFMHSENADDQALCIQLMSQPGLEHNLDFARKHADIISRFGRFPHRNAALGRENAPGEQEAIAEGEGW
jgi:uncharacterized protein (DUF924 family)